jgi:hypothetical protein
MPNSALLVRTEASCLARNTLLANTSPRFTRRTSLAEQKFSEARLPKADGSDHYLEFVEACRGNGKPSAPFVYAGPLTESVLLGCLATRFPATTLEWDAADLKIRKVPAANAFVRRRFRKGWEVEGL